MVKQKNKIIGLVALGFALSLSAGMAMATSSADEVAEQAKFEVAGAQVRTVEPSGIRFVTDVNEAFKTQLAEDYSTENYTWVWGTTLSFKTAEEKSYTYDADTQVWVEDNTRWYTVLAEIPETDYLTEITAQSYVKIYDKKDTETVIHTETTEAKTRSIAWAASWALNDGYTDEILTKYTSAIDGVSVTLDKEGVVYLAKGEQVQYGAKVTPAGYGVTWKSSNEGVATVDKNGKVTAVSGGLAKITASLNGVEDSYQVEVLAESSLITQFNKANYSAETLTTDNVVNGKTGVYGVSSIKNNSPTMYMTISSAYLKKLFEDATVAEITFDIILSEAKQLQLNGNNDTFFKGGYYTVSTANTYYTYHVRITRQYYTANETKSWSFRYVGNSSTEGTSSENSQFFYVDNLKLVKDYAESSLITQFNKDKYPAETLTTDNVVNGKTGVYGVSSIKNNSNTMYMTISSAYLKKLFEDATVAEITFDIILSEAKQLQLNGNNANFFNGGYYTVSTADTYYTYHVRITRQYYTDNATKSWILRYVGSASIEGTSTENSQFFYVDNLTVVK